MNTSYYQVVLLVLTAIASTSITNAKLHSRSPWGMNMNLGLNLQRRHNGEDDIDAFQINASANKRRSRQLYRALQIHGGASAIEDDSDSDSEYDSDSDSDSSSDEYDSDSDSSSDEYDSDSESEDTDTDADTDSSGGETTDTDTEEYDTESEEVETILSKSVKRKSTSGDVVDFDEPFALSPMQDMGVTLGVMLLCNKLDLTDTKIIKYARFAFVAYVILAQLFLIYVRLRAHTINDLTPITLTNPLSSLLQKQLPQMSGNGGTGDMVKNIASSFLSSPSTIMDYDLSQAKSMNSGLLIPMVMLWILHFKMGQVQPLFFQTANGVKDLLFSPLFQVHVLGKNLERPFKNKRMEALMEQQEELAGSAAEVDDAGAGVGAEDNGSVEDEDHDEESDDDDSDTDSTDAETDSDDDSSDDYDDEDDSSDDGDEYDEEYDEYDDDEN